MIPSWLIPRFIQLGTAKEYDYFSNVHEGLRTSPDGWDCEFMSSQMLEWLHENADTDYDREHVTTLARKKPYPTWARRAVNLGHMDLSHIKCSVDTPEDLTSVRQHFAKLKDISIRAIQEYGFKSVHRF